LPEIIPVFPLTGALLLPHGRLPLNIFEPRYLAMVEDSLSGGRLLGMVQGDGSRPRGERGTAIFSVGCIGRLTSFSETEDGRFLVTLTGVQRFRVVEELELRRGYRRMAVDYGEFSADAQPPPETDSMPRDDFMQTLRPYLLAHGMEVNWDAIAQTPEAMLVTTLSMVCPFSPSEKQALLEAADPMKRTETMMALMRMALHGNGREGDSKPS